MFEFIWISVELVSNQIQDRDPASNVVFGFPTSSAVQHDGVLPLLLHSEDVSDIRMNLGIIVVHTVLPFDLLGSRHWICLLQNEMYKDKNRKDVQVPPLLLETFPTQL